MKITLLGTGANECIPAFRCTCNVCLYSRKAGGKNVRQNSCALIENENGDFLLIDMPPQITSFLNDGKIDDSLIKNVFFTHRHEDHILGARYLFQVKQEKGFKIKNKLDVFMPESAYLSMSGKFLFDKSVTELDLNTGSYNINLIDAYDPLIVSDMKVTPLETNHLEESFGYMFENVRGETLVYLLDAAKELPKKTLEILTEKQIDLIITECTFNEVGYTSKHSDIQTVIELKRKIKPARMILSHIGHKNMNHNDLVLLMESYGIEVGFDGMKIRI
jgi:phosphoribosyl 1,2-cyclic phosphate phosphodiesterase